LHFSQRLFLEKIKSHLGPKIKRNESQLFGDNLELSKENEKCEMFSEVFEIIDKKVGDCDFDFRKLKEVYFSWFKCLKMKAGTSAGFTGLAEYVILRAILLYFEQKLKIKFEIKSKSNDTRFFASNDKHVLITHSISMDKNMERAVDKELGKKIEWNQGARGLKPDIIIFKESHEHYNPKAIIQIKVYAVSPSSIRKEINNVKKMTEIRNKKPLLVIIFFSRLSNENKEKLKEKFDYVITPESLNFGKMLQDVYNQLL
jgi:hypothetical protein